MTHQGSPRKLSKHDVRVVLGRRAPARDSDDRFSDCAQVRQKTWAFSSAAFAVDNADSTQKLLLGKSPPADFFRGDSRMAVGQPSHTSRFLPPTTDEPNCRRGTGIHGSVRCCGTGLKVQFQQRFPADLDRIKRGPIDSCVAEMQRRISPQKGPLGCLGRTRHPVFANPGDESASSDSFLPHIAAFT